MSLRARLLIASVTLVTLGLLTAGSATYAFLRSALIGRVDEQLQGSRGLALQALRQSERAGARSRLGPRNGPAGRRPSRAPDSTYAELRDLSGETISNESFGFGSVEALPLLPVDLPGSGASRTQPSLFTTGSIGDSDLRYRVLAAPLRNSGGTLVVAIPLTEVDQTLGRLLRVEALVTLSVVAVMGTLSFWLVRVGLRPLESMGATADAIAGGDRSRRVSPADERTEVGRLGLALNAMLDRIEAAFAAREASEERLRRFVADASHELRTPLTSIRGYAELFRQGADKKPKDLTKSMQRIEQESARMGTLVEDLLLLARLDQGRPQERLPVDLTKLIEQAIDDTRVTAPGHEVEFTLSESIFVSGDEAQLRQVVANLLSNAVLHTPEGTQVSVALRRTGETAVVEVTDDGPGMNSEIAEHVFERFFRADPARSRQRGGSGLGLSIVSSIVEAHGGEISVSSQPGAGSTFTVTLPLTKSG